MGNAVNKKRQAKTTAATSSSGWGQIAPAAMTLFQRRYGPVGKELGDALSSFSFDLVGIVASYLVLGLPYAGATAKFLFALGGPLEPRTQVPYDSEYTEGTLRTAAWEVRCNLVDRSVWIGDERGCQAFSAEGKFLFRVGAPTIDRRVTGIAFDTNGEAFLVGNAAELVYVCRMKDGKFLRSFGAKQFDRPWGAACNGQGLVAVAARHNFVVKVFSRSGDLLHVWGRKGSGDGEFDYPAGIGYSPAGEWWIGDYNNHRVQVLDGNGKFLRKFGQRGQEIGDFDSPTGISFDREGVLLRFDCVSSLFVAGNAYVGDWGNNRVQIFSPDGKIITVFGERGLTDGRFNTPEGLACDPVDGRIYVGDWSKRVLVFCFED